MANRYLAHGETTRARETLQLVLDRYPAESSASMLLAQMEINAGRTYAGLAMLSHLISAPLPVAVERQAAELYAQVGMLSQARDLARRALAANEDGREERELMLRLDEEARDPQAVAIDQRSAESVEERASANEQNPDPESERLRALLSGGHSAGSPDADFLADVTEAVRKWKALGSKARSESRVLAEVRVDRLQNDLQSTQHVQQVIAIGSRADALAYSEKAVQYAPESQQLNVLRARIHKLSGRILEAEDEGESAVADASVAMYYDLRAHQYRFPDVEPGDVIELEYIISPFGDRNPYGRYFAQIVGFSGPLPCAMQRYVLRAPASITLHSAEHLVAAAQVRHTSGENI
jgi:tetratricopeptide (TPR) repeat protein